MEQLKKASTENVFDLMDQNSYNRVQKLRRGSGFLEQIVGSKFRWSVQIEAELNHGTWSTRTLAGLKTMKQVTLAILLITISLLGCQ